MNSKLVLSSVRYLNFTSIRSSLRPVANTPFYGVYRKEGETVLKDDLLIVQKKLNWHPGRNVYVEKDRHICMLKSNVDGKLLFSKEKVELDMSIPDVRKVYGNKFIEDLYKLTVNVIPFEESNTFVLKSVK
uniref:RIBOSOMAL_L9 domain-containing protein n=1 Tax=Strongyloides venezuelensis TaxID=75913 RepID=A0A0K0G1G2_STRVS